MDERVALSVYHQPLPNQSQKTRGVTFRLTSGQVTSPNGDISTKYHNNLSSPIIATTASDPEDVENNAAELTETKVSCPDLNSSRRRITKKSQEHPQEKVGASRMFCTYRFCILLLFVKVFLLGVILPVRLQQLDYQQPDYDNSGDDPHLHGFPNPNDEEYHGHNHVAPPEELRTAEPTEASEQPSVPSTNDDIQAVQQIAEMSGPGTTTSSPEESSTSASPASPSSADDDENSGSGSESASATTTSPPEDSTSEPTADTTETIPSPDLTTPAPQEIEPTTVSDTTTSAPASTDDDDDDESPSKPSGTCSHTNAESPSVPVDKIMEKLEGLLEKVNGIDGSIHKMESLMQSTVVDERIYKCIAAITTGNQTLALKYWNQILRYQSSPTMKITVLKQLIRESYSGKESNLYPVVKFIQATEQFYGYTILLKELTNYDQLYSDKGGIFTLAYYIKKSCGKDSDLFKKLPVPVQSVLTGFFSLQSKFNKGYLYYAKRCVAKHYYHCLDVLTKIIDKEELEALESEERRRYHWKLNATDDTASKFFILNQDKYWSYRLQDLHNSPRFKMEEAGSIFEMEWAHFQLKLHSDSEIAVQVRDTNMFLEGVEIKFDNTTEVLLHSYYKTDGVPDAGIGNRIYWEVNKVSPVEGANGNGKDVVEHENCKVEVGENGNGNGKGNGESR